jgi:serine/threonine protein kinase
MPRRALKKKTRKPIPKILSFDFQAGRILAGKYAIESRLGAGYEGEVYKVEELRTGIPRAAKLFFPHRNPRDRAVKFYARKLDRLRRCPIVIQYYNSETIQHKRQQVTCLISEFVEGELLDDFIVRQQGQRLKAFEALHLVYALACGLEQFHSAREYHGDIHPWNILVKRRGIFFDLKLVDLYQQEGLLKAQSIREDVISIAHLLYDSVGGPEHYWKQPAAVRNICRGLRRDLIMARFPTARHLREHLESFLWDAMP